MIAEGGEGAEGETEEPVPSEQDKPPHDNYVNFDIAKTVLEANTRKERGRFATHTALTPHTVTALLNFALFFVFVVFFCPGDSLPPMSAVNGFDHDRAPQRHSTAFSDLDDDEEEDYPREVGLASLFFCHHVIDFSLSLLSLLREFSWTVALVNWV